MSNGCTLVSYLHPNVVCHNFMDSLWRLWQYDKTNGRHLHERFAVRSGPNLDGSRNVQAKIFLEQTKCEWLWIVDSDMGFEPTLLARLLKVADPKTRPVVGGLYWGFFETVTDGKGGWLQEKRPIGYHWTGSSFQNIPEEEHPEGSVLEVDAVGTGCVLIHRSILEALGKDWFSFAYLENGTRLGEDLSFCLKVRSVLKKPIFLDTGSVLTHQKTVWI